MRRSLFFKQKKPLTVIILAVVFLIIGCISLIENSNELSEYIFLFTIGFILLGYSVSFEIREDLGHKKHFKFFEPEYIVVFSTSASKSSEWGPIAAIGNRNKESSFVIRFFRGREKFTVWRTNSIELAKSRAEELSLFLGVEIHD